MKIKDYFFEYGYAISEIQEKRLYTYYEYLVEQNKVMNLTAITDYDEVVIKHFIDSMAISKLNLEMDNKIVADVGSGAGFPGLVLAIMFPKTEFILIDSLNKRVGFLNRLIEKLDLTNVKAIHARGEEFVQKHKIKFDIVVSRAVAYMDKLLKYCIPLLKSDGVFVAYKGKFTSEEEEASKKILSNYRAKIIEKIEFNLTERENTRTIIKVIRNNLKSGSTDNIKIK